MQHAVQEFFQYLAMPASKKPRDTMRFCGIVGRASLVLLVVPANLLGRDTCPGSCTHLALCAPETDLIYSHKTFKCIQEM